MERGSQTDQIAVDVAGIIVARGHAKLFRESGELLDQRKLHIAVQKCQVRLGGGRRGAAFLSKGAQQAADARVRILHVVHGVLRVLAHGETEVEFHLRLGLGVEEVAAGIHGNLVEQVGKRDRLAGTLGHAHDLTVAHELYQLHQHDVQTVGAVQPKRIHRTLQAGNVTVVIGAPDVDDLVKAAHGELIIMIGNVAGEIGVEAVGAAQHVVLELKLVNIGVLLAGLAQLFARDVRGAQPERAVLFIGPAQARQLVHHLGDEAGIVQGGFEKPLVKLDPVALEVGLHLGNIAGKTKFCQRVAAGLLFGVEQSVAVLGAVGLGQLADIVAVIAVLGELHSVLAADELDIARLNALGELVDLVAKVVDVELTPHICAIPAEHLGERVAQDAAAGVAHVHGAGGVGGDELDHILPARKRVAAAVVPAFGFDGGEHVGKPLLTETEIQKAGTGNLHRGEVGAGQLHPFGEDPGDLARVLAHCLGSGETEGGGIVAVGGVLGNFHRGDGFHTLGQQPLRRGGAVGARGQLSDLQFCTLNHVHLDVPAFIPNYQKMVKSSILYLMPENKEFSKKQRLTA